jgi:uncharacterized protein (TIGR02145 family)
MSASVRSKCVGSRARLIFSVMVVTVLSALVLVGCGKDDDTPPDDVVIDGGGDDASGGGGGEGGGGGDDSYTYSGGTVEIGGKTWMAENLNRAMANSKCYDNDTANCEKYGRLYTWDAAKSACPSGWHLPSDDEWTTLTDYVGSNAGTKLKSSIGWTSYSNVPAGTDDYGFSAFPGGRGLSGGNSFAYAGKYGDWWSATEGAYNSALTRGMRYDDEIVHSYWNSSKDFLLSVRCVQD